MASVINEKLNNSNLLENLRLNQKKYSNIKESKSLVSVYEHHIFVWHDAGSCILTSELNALGTKDFTCLKLTLSNPPVFDVDSMLFNSTGSLIALCGKNGVTIFEVPWRYGKFTPTSGDNDSTIGRSWNVAEYFFASLSSKRVKIVQVSWHPGSSSNIHLTVLSTDNYIRIYNVTDPLTPQQVISLGASSKNSYLSSESKISFSTCFGENAVSFDFGTCDSMFVPHLSSSRAVKTLEEVCVWPMYVLNGNGDIFVVKSPLKSESTKHFSKVVGPLTMYPSSEDNYGYEACQILCLQTIPTCLVVASATGIIYHCIVIEDFQDENNVKPDSSWNNETYEESDIALYVFESVELPLSLVEDEDDVFSHPIRLYKDIVSHSKYHCTHVSGLHSVAVPFLQALQDGLDSDMMEKALLDERRQPSVVEHVICTKPFSQMESIPVLGRDVAISDAEVTLVCLLSSWEFVCLPLVSSFFSNVPQLLAEEDNVSSDGDKSFIPMFEQQIEKTLQRSICCPYIKSGTLKDPNSNPQQWLDLLCNVTQSFRQDYVQRLNAAHALLRSRIKVLTQQKEFQLSDFIKKTHNEKEALKTAVERLADRYEDANANQQRILKRIETVLLKFQQNLPYLTKAELNMKESLLSFEEKIKVFESSLEQIRKKLKHQKENLSEASEQVSTTRTELNSLNLTETQTKHVNELLMKETESITELMKTVSTLKKQIGL